jgi:DNA-binding NtrC family response regulator
MKPRVALLDDEQRMVEILSMILGRDGYDVRSFTDPDTAIAAVCRVSMGSKY